MKKLKLFVVLMTLLSVFANTVTAQRKPGWIAENGFWQVITSKNDPSTCTVQFYNLDSKLLYQEKITGKPLDLQKRRICKMLNKTLKTALLASINQKTPLQDKKWVAMQLRQ